MNAKRPSGPGPLGARRSRNHAAALRARSAASNDLRGSPAVYAPPHSGRRCSRRVAQLPPVAPSARAFPRRGCLREDAFATPCPRRCRHAGEGGGHSSFGAPSLDLRLPEPSNNGPPENGRHCSKPVSRWTLRASCRLNCWTLERGSNKVTLFRGSRVLCTTNDPGTVRKGPNASRSPARATGATSISTC